MTMSFPLNAIYPVGLYAGALLSGLFGLRALAAQLGESLPAISVRRQRLVFRQVADALRECEESLAAGLVPSSQQWSALADLPAPWGTLAFECVRELRAAGGSVRPTLKRLRELAESQDRLVAEARARASQALGQAAACAVLAPGLGVVLYFIAPGVDQRVFVWSTACLVSFALSGGGALWMLSMAERARWAGLSASRRHWILAVQCSGERFLSMLRGGNPADLAWSQACGLLAQQAPELAARWGHSFWKAASGSLSAFGASGSSGAEQAMAEAGETLRKAVHSSLMDGRPCGERVEAALEALRHDLRVRVEAELAQLPNRALRPLFVCVAPAILGLLAFALYLCWLQAASDL
jgi:hypothetical protein